MADDPKYVRLAPRNTRGILLDLDSSWSISGMDVQEFPDPEKRPVASRYVRDQLRRGNLEPASKAEYEEVQEVLKQLSENFTTRLKRLQEIAPVAAMAGLSIHQESQVRQLASSLATDLQRKRDREEQQSEYKAEVKRRRRTMEQADEDDGEEEYDDMNVSDLRSELSRRGLSTGGNKDALVARLEQNDERGEDEEDDEEDEG